MSIEVPVLEVFDLADRLRAAAQPGADAAARLVPAGRAGAVAAALDDALDAFRARPTARRRGRPSSSTR